MRLNLLKKSTILFSLLALGAVILCNIPDNHTQQPFLKHVQEIEDTTWDFIKTSTGITMNDCDEYLNEYGQIIKDQIKDRNAHAHLEPITELTRFMVEQILQDCGLDITTIAILPISGLDTPAKAGNDAIYIDEAKLATLNSHAQLFVIAHEISHIKFQDSMYATALHNLLKTKENPDHRAALNAFLNAIETRADIYAMLVNKQYAFGGINTFEDYIAKFGDFEEPTHPSASKRLKVAQDIHAMHLAQNA